jgi:hypothetical protein
VQLTGKRDHRREKEAEDDRKEGESTTVKIK